MPFTYPDCKRCSDHCVLLEDGKLKGKQSEPLCCLFCNAGLPSGNIEAIFDKLKNRIIHAGRNLHPKIDRPSDQAFRNIFGAWFEKILYVVMWNKVCSFNKSNPAKKRVLISLPHANVMEFWKLFDLGSQSLLKEGLFRSMEKRGIKMTMSNPDFVCITKIQDQIVKNNFSTPINAITLKTLNDLDSKYQHLKNTCSYDSILFGLSVKSQLRPDRRYQIIYEGSILKALIAHLMLRYWDKSFETKYYGLTHKPISSGDAVVFSNPSIDSLISVWVEPRMAVDEIVSCTDVSDVERVLDQWLI